MALARLSRLCKSPEKLLIMAEPVPPGAGLRAGHFYKRRLSEVWTRSGLGFRKDSDVHLVFSPVRATLSLGCRIQNTGLHVVPASTRGPAGDTPWMRPDVPQWGLRLQPGRHARRAGLVLHHVSPAVWSPRSPFWPTRVRFGRREGTVPGILCGPSQGDAVRGGRGSRLGSRSPLLCTRLSAPPGPLTWWWASRVSLGGVFRRDQRLNQ